MTDNDLTVLTITRNQPYAQPFLRAHHQLAQTLKATRLLLIDGDHIHCTDGLMETQLNHAVSLCTTRYILQIYDDEKASLPMEQWLADRQYREHDHWAFPLACLYPDRDHYITTGPLWPDWQTRLSTKEKSDRPAKVHAASPHGRGHVAPVPLEHHKYIVRTREDREETLARYEEIGAHESMRIFSLPEDFDVETAPYEPELIAA